jgi:cyclophilin family peptidyl-prolyl cis-trans isomerase
VRFLLLTLLAACGGKRGPAAPEPAPEAHWLILNPSTPALCVPFLGEPQPDVVTAWRTSIAAIEARDVEAAAAALLPEGSHPAHDAARGIIALLTGDERAPVLLDGLIDADRPDPCVLAAAATAVGMRGDLEAARARITVAQSIAPNDPEIALLFAYMADVDRAPLAMPALERGAALRPDRPAFPVALGIASIAQGDNVGAAAWFEMALDAGEASVAGMLLQTYRASDRVDDYLRLASKLGLPLGDQGALATAEQPRAALHALWALPDGHQLWATIDTSDGELRCELFPDVAPITVANFIGLATGAQPWTKPDGSPGVGPLYADLVFHRVIPEFMVQTGDPEGTGMGGPGYEFPDEPHPDHAFDRPGRLAMANSGPDTNGSQFFVTEAPAAHLDGGYTLFGQCDDAAVEKVKAIARREGEPTRLRAVRISTTPAPTE